MTTLESGRDIRVSLGGVIRSEWIKAWGQRSTWWIIGLALVVPAFISTVWALNAVPADSSTLAGVDAVVGSTTSSVFELVVLLVIFGSQVASNEYDSRTISSTMAASPRRWPVVVAKSVLVFGIAAVVSIVAVFVGFLISSAIVSTRTPVTLASDGVIGVLLGTALFEASFAVFALTIAFLLRSGIGAIAGTFGFAWVIPGAIGLISLDATRWLASTFPGQALDSVTGLTQPADRLAYWPAIIAVIVWMLVWEAIAIVVVRRRDV